MKPIERETPAARFKLFHDLMRVKVEQVLLISTAYEAWIMEEDCRLSEHIVHEYQGLNLSRPPRLTWAASTEAALAALAERRFDLVIVIARSVDARADALARQIKDVSPGMPVVLFTHQASLPDVDAAAPLTLPRSDGFDRTFFWTGDAGLLLAAIKNIEDRLNVVQDARRAGIRIILLVEDTPFYLSLMLPVLYRELVVETQAVIDEGLNAEHRLLAMRARPKILVAATYEEALAVYEQYTDNILGVISDVRFPRNGVLDPKAGLDLLAHIHRDRFDIPLLLASSEPHNAKAAAMVPASFIDKNTASLGARIRAFLMEQLGFGDFLFQMPDGRVIGKATDLYTLELHLAAIPDEAFSFHCRRNDVSRWLYSLCEVELASRVRQLRDENFAGIAAHRRHLVRMLRDQRIQRQRGVVVNFDAERFDPQTEFLKIGKGSLGGKARGLAFLSTMLHGGLLQPPELDAADIYVPQTVVITTDTFDAFLAANHLKDTAREGLSDAAIARRFLQAKLPAGLRSRLAALLTFMDGPLAVRSSSLLEDAPFKSYAGLYKTYLLANDQADPEDRLDHLIEAVKLVYASTFFKAPRAFARRVGHRFDSQKMAVIVQRLVGRRYGDHFYPAISGVAQSENYYPFARMKPADGIASIALGLGRSVMEGSACLSFSPRFPRILPQRATVEDMLDYSQVRFYALKMGSSAGRVDIDDAATLATRDLADAADEPPVRWLSSTYLAQEHRIRDGFNAPGHPVLTFAAVLKYDDFPLAALLDHLLAVGRRKLGCAVEIEFAVDLPDDPARRPRLALLQIRPMSSREEMLAVEISAAEQNSAVCVSRRALGNTINTAMTDIVYVRPEQFDPARTIEIAGQIARFNARLAGEGRNYVLIGPGRWGSADRWLGIPVDWADINGVGAIVETTHPAIHADPSQGSHFFHNLATLGISYLHVDPGRGERLDWEWLSALPVIDESEHVVHAAGQPALTLKVDGRSGRAVLLPGQGRIETPPDDTGGQL